MSTRNLKRKIFFIFLLILFCLIPYSFWGKDGFRRELLAKDYFSSTYISIPTILLKANSNDYFPYNESTFKYTRFYSFKNTAWLESELNLLLPKLKLMEKIDENLTGDYFRLKEQPEASFQYELLEAKNAAVFFITINGNISCFAITKASNTSNAYLFSNMSKRFFDSADPNMIRFYSYLEIPLPLHHISDERMIFQLNASEIPLILFPAIKQILSTSTGISIASISSLKIRDLSSQKTKSWAHSRLFTGLCVLRLRKKTAKVSLL